MDLLLRQVVLMVAHAVGTSFFLDANVLKRNSLSHHKRSFKKRVSSYVANPRHFRQIVFTA